MKKIIAIAFLVILIQSWGDIKDYFMPRASLSYAPEAEVVLYTTTWCGYCTKTKNLLDGLGVAYREVDVEHSREGRRQFEALGGRGVPLLKIGENIVRGYNPEAVRRLLN